MEFGIRFGMAPEFSGVVSHSREALARSMKCREALARTMEWVQIGFQAYVTDLMVMDVLINWEIPLLVGEPNLLSLSGDAPSSMSEPFRKWLRMGALLPTRIQSGSIDHILFPTVRTCLGASLALREKDHSAPYSTDAPIKVNAPVKGEKSVPVHTQNPFIMESPQRQLMLYEGTPSQPKGDNEPRIEEVFKEPILESVKVFEIIEETKLHIEEPHTEPITSTPILVTTTTPESPAPESQIGPFFTTPKPDKGKGIATGTEESLVKLMKASRKVHQDDAALIDFQLHDGRMVKMRHDEIDQYIKKAKKVKNVDLTKIEIGKLIAVEVTIKGGKDFLKHQAELLKEHNEKVKKLVNRKKNLYDQYV
ncbi:hypothetical protein Tco_0419207 [Tanacetum coccineum]